MRAFIVMTTLISVVITYFLAYKIQRQKWGEVLSVYTEISPTQTPTPTPTAVPTPKPSATPTPSIPKIPPEQVHGFIERFSAQYGVDANVMRFIATCESGFNPMAINKDYVGLFQFSAQTWTKLRREMGEDANVDLRFSAEEASQTAAYALSVGKRGIWPHCYP